MAMSIGISRNGKWNCLIDYCRNIQLRTLQQWRNEVQGKRYRREGEMESRERKQFATH